MSEEQGSSGPGFSEIFADTSVLFDYAIDNKQEARTLLQHDQISKVISKSVKREFENVFQRRQKLHESILKFARRGDLEQFDPPGDVRLTGNDWGYIEQLLNELMELEGKAEAVRRLNERRRRLKRAKRQLFESPDCLIADVCSPKRDPVLNGYLQTDIKNRADVRIVCEAVQWTLNGGSGAFVTSDLDDLLSNADAINKHIEQWNDEGVLDIFSVEGFVDNQLN